MLHIAILLALTTASGKPAEIERSIPIGTMPYLGPNMEPIVAMSHLQRLQAEAERQRYSGSIFRFGPEIRADGVAPNVLHTMVEVLSRLDYVPDDRPKHFAWCDEPRLAVVGWSGRLIDVRTTRNGWIVSVRVSPRLVSNFANATVTLDYLIERYFFARLGEVQFLGSEAPPDARQGSLLGL